MAAMASGILKSPDVRMAGPRKIGPRPGRAAGPGERPATARIVEQAAGRAVIEITCPCGRTTLLQCRYDEPPGGGEPAK